MQFPVLPLKGHPIGPDFSYGSAFSTFAMRALAETAAIMTVGCFAANILTPFAQESIASRLVQ